jgi:hypothetical protein
VHSRAARLARWQHLTRITLPAMADANKWPIRHDHCFMRVCLDAAVQTRWDRVVKRPAIRHLTNAQLEAAIIVAERIANDPALLPVLNGASLGYRREVGCVIASR